MNQPAFDALLPAEMAHKAEDAGVAKVNLDFAPMLGLAVLAGAFIALGSVFATTVAAGTGALPYGVGRLLTGLVFSLGLILVIVAGAELFTGNNLIIMAWASGKVSTGRLLRSWGVVYLGNLIGSLGTVALVFLSGQYEFGGGEVGRTALAIARSKVELGFFQAIVLGVLCNALVCLAVWLCMSARTTTDKILAIIFPVTAFVAAGFEHSIANMYFVPLGILIKGRGTTAFWQAIGQRATDYEGLTWLEFVWRNLLPVTIGNIIGGALLVGLIYWFIYLRPRSQPPPTLAK